MGWGRPFVPCRELLPKHDNKDRVFRAGLAMHCGILGQKDMPHMPLLSKLFCLHFLRERQPSVVPRGICPP